MGGADYEGLSLEQILLLSIPDFERRDELVAQGDAARRVARRVEELALRFHGRGTGTEDSRGSAFSEALVTAVAGFAKHVGAVSKAVGPQAETMRLLADEVTSTQHDLDQIRAQRHDAASRLAETTMGGTAERAGYDRVNDEADRQARRRMAEASDRYSTAIARLADAPQYGGPRVAAVDDLAADGGSPAPGRTPAPDPSGDSAGHSPAAATSGPSAVEPFAANETEHRSVPQLQSTHTAPSPVTTGPAATAPPAPGAGPAAPPTLPAGLRAGPPAQPPPAPSRTTVGPPRTSPRPVAMPARPGPPGSAAGRFTDTGLTGRANPPAAGQPPRTGPRPAGSVIGSRPGTSPPGPGLPARPVRTVHPPVIGQRHPGVRAVPAPEPAPPTAKPAGSSQPPAPRPSALPPAVIRGARDPRTSGRSFSRAPKPRHGGTEPNRSLISGRPGKNTGNRPEPIREPHRLDDIDPVWQTRRTVVPPVITSRGRGTDATEADPGFVAMREGMRARPVTIRFEYPTGREESPG